MSKDLFEIQVGETLRKAEATPPKGAWEAIRSQIPQSGASPFSFPTVAVIVTAGLLLGGVVASDMARTEADTNTVIAAENISTSSDLRADKIDYTSAQAEVNSSDVQIQELDMNPILEESKEETIEDSSIQKAEETTSQKAETTETASDEGNLQMPVIVQAPRLLDTETEEKKETISNPESTNPEGETTIASEKTLLIEGIKTCYTPCELSLSAKGDDADHYSWDAGKFGFSEQAELNLVIEEPTDLTIYLTGYFDEDFQVETSHHILVKEGSTLFVPDAFSPNGDGFNEEYFVEGTGIESFTMSIVDSRGKVVFQTNSIEEHWTFDPSLQLANEVYTVVVGAIGVDGKSYVVNQPLTIVR